MTALGNKHESFDITQPIGITMEYEALRGGETFTHSYNFHNEEGLNIFNLHDTVSPARLRAWLESVAAGLPTAQAAPPNKEESPP